MKNLADYVMIVNDAVKKDYAQSLINIFEKRVDAKRVDTIKTNSIKCSRFDLIGVDTKDDYSLFVDMTNELYKFYKTKTDSSLLPEDIELDSLHLTRFDNKTPEGMLWHNNDDGSNILTVQYCLNDVDVGGQFTFKGTDKDLTLNARRGRIIVYPSNWLYTVMLSPPVDAPCYVVTTNIKRLKGN